MNRNDLRRLEKAAREKDKKYLFEWAEEFENQINYHLQQQYNKVFKDEMTYTIDNFIIAIAYTVVFSETTNLLDSGKLPDFMEDLFATIDLFKTGEYKPEEYKEILENNGFKTDGLRYVPRRSPIIFICGTPNIDYEQEGFIVINRSSNKEVNEEKIKLADKVYIVGNKEDYKEDIELAKKYNKQVVVEEDIRKYETESNS